MGLWLLLACHSASLSSSTDSSEEGGTPITVQETITARGELDPYNPTLLWVQGDIPEGVTAWVEFGPDETYGFQTPTTTLSVAKDAVPVLGLPAGVKWHWRLRAEAEGVAYTSEDQTLQIPPAPAEIPTYTLTAANGDVGKDWVLIPFPMEGWVVIYNRLGQPVWWVETTPGAVVSEARLSRDGRSVLYMRGHTPDDLEMSAIVQVDLVTLAQREIEVSLGHHGFTELPDGRFAVLTNDIRTDMTYGNVVGDTIQLLSMNGETTELWNIWDVLDPYFADVGTAPRVIEGIDWSHCNSVSYDEEDNLFLVSCYNLYQIFAIQAWDGKLAWTFGAQAGLGPQLQITGDGPEVLRAHSPVALTDGRVLMFHNRDSMDAQIYSEVLEIEVDAGAGTYRRAWSDDASQRYFTYAMGNAQRLENGDTFSTWGNVGAMRQVSADGELVWQIDRAAGGVIGFGQQINGFGVAQAVP